MLWNKVWKDHTSYEYTNMLLQCMNTQICYYLFIRFSLVISDLVLFYLNICQIDFSNSFMLLVYDLQFRHAFSKL